MGPTPLFFSLFVKFCVNGRVLETLEPSRNSETVQSYIWLRLLRLPSVSPWFQNSHILLGLQFETVSGSRDGLSLVAKGLLKPYFKDSLSQPI